MAGKPKIYDFGFNPDETHHHFAVLVPAMKIDPNVYIFEYCEWSETKDRKQFMFEMEQDPACRVAMARDKWKRIAEDVKAEFNKRLRNLCFKTAKWKRGITLVNREMGKELVLLAWSVEEADPTMIPYAVKNWLGLSLEERWWLFTMTNAATGQAAKGRGKGWRKAVRYALTENPVTDVVEKRAFSRFESEKTKEKPKGKNKRKAADNGQLKLFDLEDEENGRE